MTAVTRVVVSAVLLLGFGTSVLAQDDGAQTRFNEAVEEAKAGNHDKAIALCLKVLEELPAGEQARVHKLLGFSYRGLQKLPEAWHHLSQYVESTGQEDQAIARWLEKVETQLKESFVKVVVTCNPDGASLVMPSDGGQQPNYACPLTWWFKPGKHTVIASLDGHETRTDVIEVRERGDKGVHSIVLSATGGSVEPQPDITKPAGATSTKKVAGWALVGGGVALGVVGAILHGVANSTNDDLHDQYWPHDKAKYDAEYEDQVKGKSTAAYVLYGVGGAAAVGGAVVLILSKKDKKPVAVLPVSMPGGAGAMFSLEF